MYDKNKGDFYVQMGASTTAEDITAAGAVYAASLLAVKRFKITGFKFYVTTVVATSTANAVVKVTRRPTYNSTSGAVDLDTITIPTGTAVGTVLYTKFAPVTVEVGDQIVFEHVTQGTDASSATGAGMYAIEYEGVDEYVGNEPNMTLSA